MREIPDDVCLLKKEWLHMGSASRNILRGDGRNLFFYYGENIFPIPSYREQK